MSHDLEDIINFVEGRAAFVAEVRVAQDEMKTYLIAEFAGLLVMRDFIDILPGLVAHDALHAQRLLAIRQRLMELSSMQST